MRKADTWLNTTRLSVFAMKGRQCFCNERKFSERDGPRVGFLSSGVIRACLNAEEKTPL